MDTHGWATSQRPVGTAGSDLHGFSWAHGGRARRDRRASGEPQRWTAQQRRTDRAPSTGAASPAGTGRPGTHRAAAPGGDQPGEHARDGAHREPMRATQPGGRDPTWASSRGKATSTSTPITCRESPPTANEPDGQAASGRSSARRRPSAPAIPSPATHWCTRIVPNRDSVAKPRPTSASTASTAASGAGTARVRFTGRGYASNPPGGRAHRVHTSATDPGPRGAPPGSRLSPGRAGPAAATTPRPAPARSR